jgi:hypothetical protein
MTMMKGAKEMSSGYHMEGNVGRVIKQITRITI